MACKIKVNRHGFLAFRIYWQSREFWQGTDWRDTPANRRKAEGNKAHLFRPKETTLESTPSPLTVQQRFVVWIETKKPPFIRRGLERDYRQQFKNTFFRSWATWNSPP